MAPSSVKDQKYINISNWNCMYEGMYVFITVDSVFHLFLSLYIFFCFWVQIYDMFHTCT